MDGCPKCFLPREVGAWQCDGCGYEFSQDVEAVRAALQRQVASSRTALWVSLGVGIAVIGGLVYLATIGFIYVSVPLMLAAVGSIGHAVHRRSVSREHLESFNRRHAPLPKATAQLPAP
jgi:hypothetical protein